jgi:hypothetical protein
VLALLPFAQEAKAQDHNPFKISREQFFAKCKTVALIPIRIPKDIARYDSARVEFDSLLTSALQQVGLVVVPSKEYEEIRRQAVEEAGALFDPLTGAPDTTKSKQIVERCRGELLAKFKAEALLFASIRGVSVPFSGAKAKWHGASESLLSKGGISGFFSSASNSSGRATALSLFVVIADTNGADMYVNAGGIQVTHKILNYANQFVPVPKEQILADKKRNTEAVRLALEPLLGKAAAKKEK